MIRANLLLCIFCVGIARSLGDDDLSSNSTLCEERSPDDIFFDLSNMGLQKIRKNFVSSPGVTCLNLAENDVRTIEPGAFDGLPELKYLDLSMNLVSFHDFISTPFPKLQKLVMDGPFNQDQEYAQFGYNFNDNYNSDVTNMLPNLKKLSLCQHNGLLASRWLERLITPKLTHLYLSNNYLDDFVTPDYFASSIQHINLDANRIQNFLHALPNLRSLSMNHNQIKSLCNTNCGLEDMSLRGMPQLEELSLINNGINLIEVGAFEHSGNLRILNLGINSLEYFSRRMFVNMTNLNALNLSNNQLTEVLDICELKNLVELRLDGNKIISVDETSFCDLPKLAVINLSHNGLQSVSVDTFDGLLNLQELDLSWNNLKSLPDSWMGFESSLHTLRLDGNAFDDFANMSLGHLKELKLLSMGRNPIKTITVQSTLTLPMNMKIDVSRSDCT